MPPPKKISVSEVWVIFRGSPRFLAISGQCPIASISTLNLLLWLTKLGGTANATKKWPTLTTDLVPAGITDKRPFLHFAEKRFFGRKSVFSQKKNTQNPLRRYFFVCTTLPGHGQNMVSIKKWTLFLGPKFCISARKSIFRFRAPDFVNDLFVGSNFWQQVFPQPTVGASFASNSPSALSAQALRISK